VTAHARAAWRRWLPPARRARWRACAAAAALTASICAAAPARAQADTAAALRARHAALREALQHNEFKRPIALESRQTAGDLEGDIYALVDHPFERVDATLKGVAQWCDILMLHLNVKHCKASAATSPATLVLNIGKKYDQPLDDTFRVQFSYRVAASTPDYLQVQLRAAEGPLGTRDYRIALAAVALDARHSFLHLTYAYSYGMAARLAMQGYLATLGRGKVGFSVVGRDAAGKPVYVDNVRGVVERNTMRYYLAIDAALDTPGPPTPERQDKRLRSWFAATERYPIQLHELDQDEYLDMKRKELRRQQSDRP
jgi:hypothetical protein